MPMSLLHGSNGTDPDWLGGVRAKVPRGNADFPLALRVLARSFHSSTPNWRNPIILLAEKRPVGPTYLHRGGKPRHEANPAFFFSKNIASGNLNNVPDKKKKQRETFSCPDTV